MPGTCRDYLAEPIKAELKTWKVEAAPAEPGQVKRGAPFLAVFRADLAPGSTTFNLTHEMELHLYAARDGNDSKTEEELEGYLDQLLVILAGLDRFEFKNAERSVFKSVFQGYKITGSITTENIYRTAALAARKG